AVVEAGVEIGVVLEQARIPAQDDYGVSQEAKWNDECSDCSAAEADRAQRVCGNYFSAGPDVRNGNPPGDGQEQAGQAERQMPAAEMCQLVADDASDFGVRESVQEDIGKQDVA